MTVTRRFVKVLWHIAGVFYFPLYLLAILLNVIARFMLGVSHIGMLNKRMGTDILKSLFKRYNGKIRYK